MSTHNICFCGEIRKLLCGYPLLSVAMVPHFMIVLISYINLLNLSWIIKCLFLKPFNLCHDE